MNNKYLAIYDLSGIQKFIFSTNKMKDIIGGSMVVHNALFRGIPEVFGLIQKNSWKTGEITFEHDDKIKIVYIGGGNALVLFCDVELYKEKTRELGKYVFMASGGAISLFSAVIELDEEIGLAENQKNLMAKLDEQKKSGKVVSLMPALPIVACDNNNYQPIMRFNNDQFLTFEKFAKTRATDEKIFNDITPKGISFKYDFEDTRIDNEKNYQAIIHIDGNTMGIKIREFVNKLQGNIFNQMTQMRDLSVEISNLYNETLKETIYELYADTNTDIPFRPIVADGDDITVMIEATKAFDFVETFISKLEKKSINGLADFRPTAAAGIVFVHLKYPFYMAYEMAESCCKNAKSKTIERCGGAEKFLNNPISSMDFQVCYSNISSTVNDFRDKNYGEFIKRPYMFIADNKEDNEDNEYSYSKYIKMCNEFNESLKIDLIAKSKLKGLRNSFADNTVDSYIRYIRAHCKNDEEKKVAQKIKKESIFDYLDIIDIVWKEIDK